MVDTDMSYLYIFRFNCPTLFIPQSADNMVGLLVYILNLCDQINF